MTGNATRLNFFKSGLPGPKVFFQAAPPFIRILPSNVSSSNFITGSVSKSALQWPVKFWERWKGILGQRQIK
jgi:hypothetical protein